MATTNILQFAITTILSISIGRLNNAIFFPTRESLNDWFEYFSLALPVMIMFGAEITAIEIFNLASGYLGVKAQAA